jgi:shikimate kinase
MTSPSGSSGPPGHAGVEPGVDGPVVVLVGPPGAGKSTVAALLASRLGVAACDTDDLIEARAGKPIADIFVDDGEPAFRELERSAVAEALGWQRGVVALGGGAVADAATRELLGAHRVVFLDVGLAAAAARVGFGATRPLLLGNVRSQLKALLDARRPLYEEVARATVVTDDLSVDAVTDSVERHLHA